MIECRHCGEYIQGDPKENRVRCPRCKEPLFERPGAPELVAGSPPEDKGVCPLHQGNLAIGTCKRCGNFFCPVCRTRWKEQILCSACVERLVSNQEANPEESAAHGRQAILGLILGVAAWLLVGLGGLTLMLASGRPDQTTSLLLAAVLVISSLIPAILGLGQAASAIRTRGQRMFLATSGLVLSGSLVGIFLGMILLQLGRF